MWKAEGRRHNDLDALCGLHDELEPLGGLHGKLEALGCLHDDLEPLGGLCVNLISLAELGEGGGGHHNELDGGGFADLLVYSGEPG